MNVAQVPSVPRKGGQAHLCWICIRLLLIFALALLPIIAAAVALFMALREQPMTGQQAAAGEEETEVAER